MWPSLAVAAAGIIAVVWVTRPEVNTETTAPPASPVVVQAPRPAPVYAMALDKPEVRLSLGALTWRSSGRQGDLVADLKPGLDAFRRDDHATARRELAALTSTYPRAIEVLLYLGVSQLFLGETEAARDNLTKALAEANTAGPELGVDAAWYLAIADERLGNKEAARTALTSLCRGTSARGPAACVAAAAIK